MSVASKPDELPPGLGNGRIVGGILAPSNSVPWIISLQVYGHHICGGSIISSKRILTAAHCTDDVPAFILFIRAGSLNYTTGGQLINVKSVTQHNEFNSTTLTNDIAIIKLAAQLILSSPSVRAIKLPKQDASIRSKSLASVAGWGFTSENSGNVSTVLRSVQVPIVDQRQCNKWYDGAIDAGMVCAGEKDGEKDSCTYDSGGPLTLNNRLIGVVSWGAGCARPEKPGVYTRVAHFRDWVDSNV